MSENVAQHVQLAVPSALAGDDAGGITFQQVGERVGAEHAGVDGQLATINLGLLLPCPLLGVSLQPECPGER
jgi:hypothetical protein